MKHLKGILTLGLIFATGTSVYGQYEDLSPRNWFPLELGNYWHYDSSSQDIIPTVRVITSLRDTVVDNQRWALFQVVYCEGPNCPGGSRWYRFTEDHYLQFAPTTFAWVDTLGKTLPRSIFTVTTALDTTLRFITPAPGLSPVVSIDTLSAMGNVADTTDLVLNFDRGLSAFGFRYRIGLADGLVGARVNGLEVGDLSLINSVVLSSESTLPLPEVPLKVIVYPNPFEGQTNIEIRTEQAGNHLIEVFNILGQRIIEVTRFIHPGRPYHWTWSSRSNGLNAGIYLIRVSTERGEQVTTTLHQVE